MSGFVRNTYVADQSRILSMKHFFLERDALPKVGYKKYKPPRNDAFKNKLT